MSVQIPSEVHARHTSPFSDNEYNNEINDDELSPILGKTKENFEEVRIQSGSGWLGSAFLVVNAALGAGLLNFPIAYHQAGGVLIAVVIQSVFLVFVVAAILILGYCSDIKKTNTYQDVVHSVCGPTAQLACAVAITLYCFGTCITFLIIIGDQWELFFIDIARTFFCGTSPFYMSRSFTIVVSSTFFILPLCFPKKIDFLKYASVIGVIGILYVVALVTIKYFLPHPPPGEIATINLYFSVERPKSWIDVFLVVPDICFAYQCHVSIIPIYSCMENRNLKEFSKTISLAMVLCVLTYTVTAALGYLQFGDRITNDILLSFEPDAPVIIAVALIAMKTYTTYPILLFCGRAGFDCVWSRIWGLTPEQYLRNERKRRIIVTIVWFILTLLGSIFIPNIGVVIQVLGAFAAIFIFIFPGMCLLKTMQNRIETGIPQPRKIFAMKWFAIFFIILGGFIFGLTLSQAVIKDIKGVAPDKSNYTCTNN